MQVDGAEGHVARIVQPHHDHAGHPEEKDVVACLQDRGGVEVAQVICVVGPAQGGVGPEGRGEPCIQHVRVLADAARRTVLALAGVLQGHRDLAAVVAVPDGDAVPPPELAGDAPVADVLHPVEVHPREPPRNDLDLPVLYRRHGRLRQGLHAHEPLLADDGLDDGVAALAVADGVAVGLDLLHQAQGLQVVHDGVAASEAVLASVGPCFFGHHPVRPHRHDGGEAVALAHLEVHLVMAGRYLQGARAKGGIDRRVTNHRDATIHDGQERRAADHALVAGVVRIHRHRHVGNDGLRAGGGDGNVLVARLSSLVQQGVADVPEVISVLLVLHLQVGQGGLAAGAPVDNPLAPIDEAVAIEVDEGSAHRLLGPFVHSEALAAPVAGDAQALMLPADDVTIPAHPLPHALQEALSPQVVAGEVLLEELLLHHVLGGYAGVIYPGQPEGGVALHAMPADEQVLDGGSEGMAQVQLARNVRGRHDDGEGMLGGIGVSGEVVSLQPEAVQTVLHLAGVVSLGHLRPGVGIVLLGPASHRQRLSACRQVGHKGGGYSPDQSRQVRRPGR